LFKKVAHATGIFKLSKTQIDAALRNTTTM